MSDKCNLIKDILPLYVEDMVSADTREFVSEHLEHCAECHAEFERMQKATKFIPDTDPDTDIVPLKRVKRDLFIKRLQTICFTAILACAIVTIVFGILTSPKFFPYADNLLNVIDVPDGSVIITFDSEVTGYSCNEVFDNETETAIYRINAWTTTWDLHLSNRGKQNMVIPGVVVGKGVAPVRTAHADVVVAAGDQVGEIAEVVGPQGGLPHLQHVLRPQDLRRRPAHQICHSRVVGAAGVALRDAHLRLHPHGGGDAGGDGPYMEIGRASCRERV